MRASNNTFFGGAHSKQPKYFLEKKMARMRMPENTRLQAQNIF
jgi:hypothetical protein